MPIWHKILGILMIYAPLSQNIAVKISALFPQMFWDWKADSANFFTFRMYVCRQCYTELAQTKCSLEKYMHKVAFEIKRRPFHIVWWIKSLFYWYMFRISRGCPVLTLFLFVLQQSDPGLGWLPWERYFPKRDCHWSTFCCWTANSARKLFINASFFSTNLCWMEHPFWSRWSSSDRFQVTSVQPIDQLTVSFSPSQISNELLDRLSA